MLYVRLLRRKINLTTKAEASFIKTSMFRAAGPFSEAVFHGGQFNITTNTEEVTKYLYRWFCFCGTKLQTNQTKSRTVGWWRQHTTTIENFTTNWLFSILQVIDFIMNKPALKFFRANWANFYAFRATFCKWKKCFQFYWNNLKA